MDSLKRWLEADPKNTQAALAERLRVSRPTVNEWVHGDCNPSSQRMHGLHEATGISIPELIADCATDAERRRAKKTAAA